MVHLVVTGALLLSLGASLRLLRPLHPVQLWLAAWSVSLSLYSLRLIPYRPMGFLTGALILGATAGFALGVIGVERALSRRARARLRPLSIAEDAPAVKIGAAIALTGTAALLALFLAQAVRGYGVHDTLVSSASVRRAVENGDFAITVKYAYFALTAVPLSVLAALLSEGRERRGWALAAAAAIGAIYFTTARSAIWLAAGSAVFVWALVAQSRLGLRQLAYAGGGLVALGAVILVGGGSLIGKTFHRTDLSMIRTSFSDHSYLEPVAIPYEYASNPIAALDLQVKAEPTWGHARGCATLAPACRVLRTLGLPTRPEPSLRAFTAAPVRWNTYTALDRPIVDGGPALVVPIILLLGAAVGVAWVVVSARSAGGIFAYALVGPAVLFTPAANFAATEHFLGPLVIGGGLLWTGRQLARRRVREPSLV